MYFMFVSLVINIYRRGLFEDSWDGGINQPEGNSLLNYVVYLSLLAGMFILPESAPLDSCLLFFAIM